MATAKKKTTNAKKSPQSKARSKSFVVSDDRPPFLTFRATHETFYWIVLGALVLALGIWVLTLTVKIQQIYDDIDVLQSQTVETPAKKQ